MSWTIIGFGVAGFAVWSGLFYLYGWLDGRDDLRKTLQSQSRGRGVKHVGNHT